MRRYFLDLFSGIGGFALGADWAGLRFDAHYFSEVDPYAIDVYSRRFPDAIPLGDIKAIDGKALPRGEWIIAGGFPCQDISVAGKGAGLAGARSGLWYEYARLIGELRPRFAIMENVGALAFRGLDSVLGSLAKIGYDAEWQDIRASDVGAPHRRERIWIVAYPEERGLQGPARIESDSQRTRPSNPSIRGKCISGAVICGEALANAEGNGRGSWRPECQGLEGRASPFGASFLSYAAGIGCTGQGQPLNASDQAPDREWQASNAVHECIGNQWATEPDVGGTIDGLSTWLDGFDGININKYNMTYGTTEKERPGEILRTLRSEIRASQDQWKARGSECVSTQEVLLAYLCKLETRLDKQTDLFVESAETAQGSLRGLRDEEEPSGTSYRPESKKQRSREHRDALQTLPRLLACDAEKAWIAYRRENASSLLSHWLPGWEDGIPRTSSNVPARVDRLKCLGNSIVPQIAMLIFRWIKRILDREAA